MPKKFDFLSPGIQITEIDQSVLPSEAEEDGPIIIGRTRQGPGMQPVRIKSLEDYIKIFGSPVPGGSSALGDVWRDGPNLSAPTYASYAAQSWLASGNSPVTVVRLLGDQSDNATDSTDGIAGWQLSASVPSSVAADNSTAYGLFIIDKTAVSTLNYRTITVGTALEDGDQFTVTDSDGNAVVIEADSGGGTTQTNNLRTFDQSGNAIAGATALAAAINAAVAGGYLNNINAIDNGDATFKIASLKGAGAFAVTTDADSDVSGDGALAAPTVDAKTDGKKGALAAIIYCDSGYLALKGKVAGGSETHARAATLVESNAAGLTFILEVYNASGTKTESKTFNFTRNSSDYIRSVLNTSPVLTSTTSVKSDQRETYWLGESFEQHVKSLVTSTTSGDQYGILLPLHKRDNAASATGNWSYHRQKHKPALSGYVIANDGGTAASYDNATATKLFRIESLHSGDDLQKDILIAIDNIKLASNPQAYPYGSFSLRVMTTGGKELEAYNNLNLDPNSENFVARKIGNQKLVWDDTNKKFDVDNDHPNVSDYIRIEMFSETADNYVQTAVPFGFLGPARPKGITLVSGSVNVHSVLGGNFSGAFVLGSGSVPLAATLGNSTGGNFFSSSIANCALEFEFPKLKLRANGTEGFVNNPNKAYFGIRPKVSTSSNLHDSDYVDYLRALPSNYDGALHSPSGDFEHSFVFSLDDIKIDSATKEVTYVSGSRQAGTSYSAINGTQALLNQNVKQFMFPLFGGRHGLDIKEFEPFKNAKMAAMGTTDNTNYLRYSIKKALDSASDPEYVPANLLTVPGIYDTQITDKAIAVAESRQDVLAIIDLDGDYKSVYESTESASSRRGSVSTVISNLRDRNIDSTFACTFFPWVQVSDKLNGNQRVWVPSSVAGLGAMAQSEAASAAWFAPAGFNRGGLGALGGSAGPVVVQARSRVDSDERDRLYSEANINPIATFPNEGVVIFGQKTLQSGVESALGRINVRRLLIYLKSKIAAVARTILFDNNVRSTWARFRSRAEPILADVQTRFGLTEYKLVLDETTTTPDLIDRNILYAQIYLKPARAIEFIAIDFIVTRTGAEFA